MRLIIVRQVQSDRLVDPARYEPFFQELRLFFQEHFRIKIAEQSDDLKIILRQKDIANVVFLSQAMIGQAVKLGLCHPLLTIVVFSSVAEADCKRITANVFMIKKNGRRHLNEAMKILNYG